MGPVGQPARCAGLFTCPNTVQSVLINLKKLRRDDTVANYTESHKYLSTSPKMAPSWLFPDSAGRDEVEG